MSLTISEISNSDEYIDWDAFVVSHPEGSFAQLSCWANLKQQFAWQSHILVVRNGNKVVAGAVMMDRAGLLGKKMSYVPYGPLVDPGSNQTAEEILEGLVKEAEQSVVLRLEPHLRLQDGKIAGWQNILAQQGFKWVEKYVQPEATLLLDLKQSESELLSGMRQTTRRYIRQAERAGLVVVEDVVGDRLPDFYSILHQVNQRRHFGVHTMEYYVKAWEAFHGSSQRMKIENRSLIQPYLFLVQKDDVVLGAYFVVRVGDKSWELYGGVNEAGMKAKASYLLKWQSILAMKRDGVAVYDQWGVAPYRVQETEGSDQEVEKAYDKRHHLAGVTYFKEGFGGKRVGYVGSYDRINQPLFYHLARALKKL